MKRATPLLCLALMLASVVPAAAAQGLGRYASARDEPLSAEQAFPMSVMTGLDGQVLVMWEMPAGYYIYQDKMEFAARGGLTIRKVKAPDGLVMSDPFMGSTRIYRNLVTIVIEADERQARGELLVKFQGCLEDRVCYPPMTRVFKLPG